MVLGRKYRHMRFARFSDKFRRDLDDRYVPGGPEPNSTPSEKKAGACVKETGTFRPATSVDCPAKALARQLA
jgi:hypothetical protein